MFRPRWVVTFVRLKPDEQIFLVRAFVDLALIDMSLRLFGFRRTLFEVERRNREELFPVFASDISRARLYARWIALAAEHFPVPARCLHRALVLHAWLRHRRIASEFRIGVRREGGRLLAHAWVELAGKIVNDPPSAVMLYTPLVLRTSTPDAIHNLGKAAW
jgi:hypothetical protein